MHYRHIYIYISTEQLHCFSRNVPFSQPNQLTDQASVKRVEEEVEEEEE